MAEASEEYLAWTLEEEDKSQHKEHLEQSKLLGENGHLCCYNPAARRWSRDELI